MTTVLITGLIGSGKSEASRYLSSLGFPVYDCDSRAKALYQNVPGLLSRCEQALGVEYSSFASCIFSDESKRSLLESILFPALKQDIVSWRSACGSDIAFIESATAADKRDFVDCYDKILLVRAPLEVRSGRNPKALERNSCQREPLCADFIIDNDGCICDLRSQIDKFLKLLQ